LKDWKSNKIVDIKKYFENSLTTIYSIGETQSIFKILIESKLGLSQKDLIINPNLKISESEVLKIQFALKRLLKNEPIQYILGETQFFDLKIKVTPSVLIPRPETEELVNWVLEDVKVSSQVSILDACTGSGCIAIALKSNLPNAKITGVDISKEALSIAKQNAEINKVIIDFFEDDILDSSLKERYDIIVSNPPYVSREEAIQMQENVLKYEPHLALFPESEDVLIFYKSIFKFALKSGSKWVYFEINQYKEEELINWLKLENVTDFTFKNDISGNLRFLKISF
jgi:release factor glutamine methyltransferase